MKTVVEDLAFLSHHGVKGQKWGVRKDRPTSTGKSISEQGKGWTIHKDGSIQIEKGTTISRVVRNHGGLFGGTGNSYDSGKPVYAAFKPADVVSYEHFFGRSKSLLVKEASAVQKLSAKTTLKAPGPKEASKLYFDTLKNDPEASAIIHDSLHGIARRNFEDALKDPSTQKAYDVYTIALDSVNYNAKAYPVNEKYFNTVKKSGYNALLDPSDAAGGFDAPIMVLNGKQNLQLVSEKIVDKHSQEEARLLYKTEAAKQGKLYLEKLGYL